MNPRTKCTALALVLTASLVGGAQEPAPPEQPPGGEVDAELAAEEVTRALRKAPGVTAAEVVVSTHADTVVLTGEVGSEVEAARATSVAEEASGGLRVSSQIAVRPGEEQAAQQQAQQLARNVEQALRQDARTANLGVAVSVDESQVIGLHGLVPSRESRTLAEDIAGRVAGARRVRSHLVVPGE